MSYSLFYDVGVAVAAATILAVVFNLLKQPTILGYILAWEHIVSSLIRKKASALRKLAKGNMKRLGMR